MASIPSSTLRRGQRQGASAAPVGMLGSELTERLAPPPRLRRRPALVAASVAAVCVGALLAVWAYSSLSTAQSVLAVRTTVHRGEVISRDVLVTVQVGVDPALSPVSSGQLGQVVGRRAALDLPAGALLTGEAVTDAVVPAAGLSVVGVALTGRADAVDAVDGRGPGAHRDDAGAAGRRRCRGGAGGGVGDGGVGPAGR